MIACGLFLCWLTEREAHDKSMGKAAKEGAKEGAQQATKGH